MQKMENKSTKEQIQHQEDFKFLADFMDEQRKTGKLNKKTSGLIETLWNEYKVGELKENHSIIEGDFGCLGSIIMRKIAEIKEPCIFAYKDGSYDYIDISSSSIRKILWTDFSDEQPYNRQSGLYCNGADWDFLGEPIKITEDYREFDRTYEYRHEQNTCFAVWGFGYNDLYGCVRFGLCIENEKVEEFLSKLKVLIGK